MPTFQDLAGFWDLLQLSIEDVTLKFLELQQLKANSWKLLEPKVCLWSPVGQEATLCNVLLRKVGVWVWRSHRETDAQLLDVVSNSFRYNSHVPVLGPAVHTAAQWPPLASCSVGSRARCF